MSNSVGYATTIESVDSLYASNSSKINLELSDIEINALKNAWIIIKADRRKYIVDVFLDFHRRYPQYYKLFRDPSPEDQESCNLNILHQHTYWVFEQIGNMIEDDLNPARFQASLHDLMTTHHFIGPQEGHYMMDIVKYHFKKILIRFMSPILEQAIDKFCMKIAYIFVKTR